MPNKIEAVITIARIGEKENKFWIKDTDGEFYSGFKEYQGTQNNEYAQLILGNHGEPFQDGQEALITFTRTAGTDKTGKDVIYKNLKGIYPAEGVKTAPPAEKRSQGQNLKPGEVVDWDEIAVVSDCLFSRFPTSRQYLCRCQAPSNTGPKAC